AHEQQVHQQLLADTSRDVGTNRVLSRTVGSRLVVLWENVLTH
ncbi:hypothetical protein F441_04480, partial [Phytophthora nicotianae CJ01A1]